MKKTLYRDPIHKVIGGVAAGLADYLNTDISIIRILLVIACFSHHFLGGATLFIYILLWIILPVKDPRTTASNSFSGTGGPSSPPQPEFEANYRVDETGQSAPHFSSNPAPNPVSNHSNFQRNQIGGIILVILGVLFLTEEYIDWDFSFFDHYWPVGLIALGIILLLSTTQTKSKTV